MHTRVIKLTGRIKERNPSPLILHNCVPQASSSNSRVSIYLCCLVIMGMYAHLGSIRDLENLREDSQGNSPPWRPPLPNAGNSLSGPKDNLRTSSIPRGWILFIPRKAAWSQCKLHCRECHPDHPLIRGNHQMLDLCERCISNGWYPVLHFQLEGA